LRFATPISEPDVSLEAPSSQAPTVPRRARRRRRLARAGDGERVRPLLDAELSPIWETQPAAARVSSVPGVCRRDAIFRRALALSDVLACLLTLALTLLLVDGAAARPRPAIVLVAPFVVLVSKSFGLYDRDQHRLRKATIDEAPTIFQLVLVFVLTVWLAEAVLLADPLSRAQVLTMATVGFVLVMGCRSVTRAVVRSFTPPERCLVVGCAADARRTFQRLDSSGINAVMVAQVEVPARSDPDSGSEQAMQDSAALTRAIEAHGAERVVIAPGGADEDQVLHCIRLVTALGVKVSVLPRLLEVVGSSSVFDDVDGLTLLGVRQFGLSKSSQLLKRSMDIVGAACGLVLLAPFFVLMAAAIKLDSRGPVFFVQTRIGRRGKRFAMVKFRSMVPGADELKDQIRQQNEAVGGLFKIAADPRVTDVGRRLRRASLDELPQLFNVLRGDMSLVGPRPLVLAEDALIEGWQRRRLAVKPGMTGLWQIFGSSRIPMPEMVKIDYLYGANWSVWLDLKILLRTVPHVVARRGL
jgi:exopolysaccharide biosynthesis polyprenyl glycosylphosphotransferase